MLLFHCLATISLSLQYHCHCFHYFHCLYTTIANTTANTTTTSTTTNIIIATTIATIAVTTTATITATATFITIATITATATTTVTVPTTVNGSETAATQSPLWLLSSLLPPLLQWTWQYAKTNALAEVCWDQFVWWNSVKVWGQIRVKHRAKRSKTEWIKSLTKHNKNHQSVRRWIQFKVLLYSWVPNNPPEYWFKTFSVGVH